MIFTADMTDFGLGKITSTLKNFYVREYENFNIDGKDIKRRVYDDPKAGLYVSIKGIKVYYEDFN